MAGALVRQFDFHTYCLRKVTLRPYMALLRFEDTIYKHKFFVRAAVSVVGCYIALHDKPALAKVCLCVCVSVCACLFVCLFGGVRILDTIP